MKQMRKLPKLKKLGDKATEADFEESLEDHLFNSLKKNLQNEGDQILQEIQEDMQEMSSILLAPFKSTEKMKELKEASPEAEDIVNKITEMVKLISGQ